MQDAKWIWLSPEHFPQYQKGQATQFAPKGDFVIARFEKTFFAEKGIASIEISADAKYRLWINGTLISIGPAAIGGDYANAKPLGWCFLDRPTAELCDGENTIVVEVQSIPEVMADYSSGHPGLYMRLRHGEDSVVTDETWLAYPAREFPAIRTFDTTCLTGELEKFYAVESPRKIAVLEKHIAELEYDDLCPVAVMKTGNQTVFDFGKIVAGYIRFDATAERQTTLTVDTCEVIERKILPEQLTLKPGDCSYLTWRLHSFRYLVVTGESKRLEIQVLSPIFPCPNEGYFRCSNERLNQLFACSLATLKLCRNTYHMDSPIHQEALGCTGDYYIESMMGYAILGEYTLSRLDIIRTAKYLELTNGKMFHTAYTLIFLRWIREHYRYTADKQLLQEVLPAVERVLRLFFGYSKDGCWLDNPPNYLFIDWVSVEDFNLHHPPKAIGEGAMNAFWYDALLAVSEIYLILGNQTAYARIADTARRVKTAFYEKLFNAEKGLFKAGTPDLSDEKAMNWKPLDFSKREYYCVHTNILAVAFGLVNGSLAKDIFEKVMQDDSLIPCQPYFYHFLFDACEQAGLSSKYLFELLERLQSICINGGLKEVFYGFDCDFSHAWGGTAVYQAVTRILGICPTSDGFTTYTTQPCLGNLTWAEGSIPTPWGKIQIKIQKGETGVKIEKREIKS